VMGAQLHSEFRGLSPRCRTVEIIVLARRSSSVGEAMFFRGALRTVHWHARASSGRVRTCFTSGSEGAPLPWYFLRAAARACSSGAMFVLDGRFFLTAPCWHFLCELPEPAPRGADDLR